MELEGIMLSDMSIRERQLSYNLSDMRNLRGTVVVCGGREGKKEKKWDQEGDKP